jgi:hypothetical protein
MFRLFANAHYGVQSSGLVQRIIIRLEPAQREETNDVAQKETPDLVWRPGVSIRWTH